MIEQNIIWGERENKLLHSTKPNKKPKSIAINQHTYHSAETNGFMNFVTTQKRKRKIRINKSKSMGKIYIMEEVCTSENQQKIYHTK